ESCTEHAERASRSDYLRTKSCSYHQKISPLKMLKQVIIQQVTWQQAEAYLREIRTSVFIEEQFVVPEFEWDEIDSSAVHLLAMHENQAIGCLRIIHYAKIGRMAVLKPWRGLGVGKMLLNAAIKTCALQGSKQI